jgi:hypothetical protein
MPVDYNHGHHPIDSTFPSESMANSTGMEFGFNFGSESGFNLDFNEFDFENMDVMVASDGLGAPLGSNPVFMEAALSIGAQENTRSDNFPADSSEALHVLPPYPSHPNVDTMSSTGMISTSAGFTSPVPSSTGPRTSVLNAPTLPEPDGIHAHTGNRPTKRKKVDEVNAAHILPEGLQRSRTKSVKAAAAQEST